MKKEEIYEKYGTMVLDSKYGSVTFIKPFTTIVFILDGECLICNWNSYGEKNEDIKEFIDNGIINEHIEYKGFWKKLDITYTHNLSNTEVKKLIKIRDNVILKNHQCLIRLQKQQKIKELKELTNGLSKDEILEALNIK